MAQLIDLQRHLSTDIEIFLSTNTIGTPGQSMVYQQLNTSAKLQHIPQPIFALLRRKESIQGMCCFCTRQTEDHVQFYIRYFSFASVLRAGSASRRSSSRSTLRQEITHLFQENLSAKAAVFYAYLDLNNTRSAKLCNEFGFEAIRTFSTLTFSRLRPKGQASVRKLETSEYKAMSERLAKEYQGYNCYTDENLFFGDQYFVLFDDSGQIRAGVQGVPEHWKILSLKGKPGRLLINLVSKTPWLNRLINKDFHFVAFDYVYLADGNPQTLESLMEAVLFMQKCYSGLIAVDDKSGLFSTLSSLTAGPLDKLKKPVVASVIARTNSANTQLMTNLSEKPFFISTMDLT